MTAIAPCALYRQDPASRPGTCTLIVELSVSAERVTVRDLPAGLPAGLYYLRDRIGRYVPFALDDRGLTWK